MRVHRPHRLPPANGCPEETAIGAFSLLGLVTRIGLTNRGGLVSQRQDVT